MKHGGSEVKKVSYQNVNKISCLHYVYSNKAFLKMAKPIPLFSFISVQLNQSGRWPSAADFRLKGVKSSNGCHFQPDATFLHFTSYFFDAFF